jgi:hypothetical protein
MERITAPMNIVLARLSVRLPNGRGRQVQLLLWSQRSCRTLPSGDLFHNCSCRNFSIETLMIREGSLFRDSRCRRSCHGDQTRLRTHTSRTSVNALVLQLDFRHLDCDVVTRPLIIKISEDSHRNDKRSDNYYCERFHQGFSSSSFFDRFTRSLRCGGARNGDGVAPSTPMVQRTSTALI